MYGRSAMSHEQPDGKPTTQPQVRRATKAIPPEPPVDVVRRHMPQMTHAQRGAVSQLIKENEQLRVELAAAMGVPRTQEVATDVEVDGDPHGLGDEWHSGERPAGTAWEECYAHSTGAFIGQYDGSAMWHWFMSAAGLNAENGCSQGAEATPQEAARLALGVDRKFFAPKVHGKWWEIEAIANTQLTSDQFEDRQREQISNAIAEALKAYDASKGDDRD